jgi:tetratricopeptide (TPR) repeat protein
MNIERAIMLGGIGLLLSYALCFAQTANDKQSQVEEHSRKAQEYLRDKQPRLAIPELQALTALDPDNVEAQGDLGVLLFFQGSPAEAIPHFRAALEKRPDLAKIRGLLGMAENRSLDFADARKDMEAAFPLLPDRRFQVQLGLELVGLYTQSGDLEHAAAVIAQLRQADPDNVEVLYAGYRVYSDLAGESMLALSLAAPDSAQMHRVIAHEETRQGNNAGAIAQYRKAIALDPKLPGIHFELAELLYSSQDEKEKKEAKQEYLAALAENREDEKTVCKLAEIDAEKGNTQKAFEGFTRAVQLQPADTDAKLGLAKTLIEMNQLDKAQALLEETVQLEPSNAIAHYCLATLYRKMGRMDDAKREVEAYKKYKDMKEKLRTLYEELQIQPKETPADVQNEK